MTIEPFAETYRKTPRHPDHKAVLDELAEYMIENARTASTREIDPEAFGETLGYAKKKGGDANTP